MKKIILTSIILSFSLPAFSAPQKPVEIKSVNKTEISTQEAKNLLNKKNYVFIDVREKSEFDEGHIKGVKLIPLSTINTEALKLDKNAKYITVCRSGRRSAKAAEEMKKLGFNVVTMKGGMLEWQEKGLPVTKN